VLENAINLDLPVVADETGSVRRHDLNLVTDVSKLPDGVIPSSVVSSNISTFPTRCVDDSGSADMIVGPDRPPIVFYAFDLLRLNAKTFKVYRSKSERENWKSC
jgi:hypothetical protein